MKPFETLSIIILIIFSLSTHAVVLAQPPEISSGLDYLKSIQKADGSWGGTETSLNGILPTTAHALTALSELEASVSPNQTNAIDFLQAQSIEVTQLLAERVIALAGAGVDVSGDVTALLGLQDTGSPLLAASPFEALFSGGGFGAAEGHSSNVLDTSFGLLALKAAGITDLDVPTRAVQFLMSQQNPDGGWGWLDQRESRLFLTALTVQALGALRSEFDVNHVLEPAVTFLRSKQNPDGGFGEQGSTAYETAMTLLAVFASGISATQAEIDGLDYLITTQQPNGSWADDAYSTALAVQALSKQAPNLIVVSINFSNLYPPEGEVVTVTATVQNLGVVDAENVVVHFYDGEPGSGGTLIGSAQTISSIPAGATGEVSADFDTTGRGSESAPIFVEVDSGNTVPEFDEADNTSIRSLEVRRVIPGGFDWNIQSLDGAGDYWTEYYSLVLDDADRPRISYAAEAATVLKYAAFDGSSWHFQTLDTSSLATVRGIQYTSLALDGDGNPRISYRWTSKDAGTHWNVIDSGVRYAAFNGTSWDIQDVDVMRGSGNKMAHHGAASSLALDADGNPRISYLEGRADMYGWPDPALKYAAFDGTGWNFQIVDTNLDGPLTTSLALDSAGNPRIAYTDGIYLKYAAFDGTNWVVQILDQRHEFRTGGSWEQISLKLDKNDNPRISYWNYREKALKYAAFDGASWDIQVVEALESQSNANTNSSLALDSSDNPRIVYPIYDGTNGHLRYAAFDGSQWDFQTVQTDKWWLSHMGQFGVALALDSADLPRIAYSYHAALSYAEAKPPEPESPGFRPPVANANSPYVGDEGNSLVFDGSGSSDPDGHALEFRWDFDGDGAFDTEFDAVPTASHTYLDDFSGNATLEAKDPTELSSIGFADVTIRNVAPVVDAGIDQTTGRGILFKLFAGFTDPGILDTHTATIDWGDGTVGEGVVAPVIPVGSSDARLDQWASTVIDYSTQYSSSGWSAEQVLGEPDSYPGYGDIPTAWASKTPDGQREYIEVGFDTPVHAEGVDIYETYNPGAVDSVYGRDTTGELHLLWSGAAQILPPEARIFEVRFPPTGFLVSSIRISLNSTAVPGWNEIDAIRLLQGHQVQAPGAVSASHVYGNSGVYTITVTVTDDDGGVGSDTLQVTVNDLPSPINVGPDVTDSPDLLSAQLIPDKRSYLANQIAILTSELTNLNSDLSFTNLSATVAVTNAQGESLLQETHAVGSLLHGVRRQFISLFETGTHAPGQYTATLTVKTQNITLATDVATFRILSSAESASAMRGEIQASPVTFETGTQSTFSYSAQNVGNVDLPSVVLKIRVVNPGTGAVVRELTDNAALNLGESFSNSQVLDTTGILPGTYLAILTGEASSSQTLDSVNLTVLERQNVPPVVDAGADREIDEGALFNLSVNFTDADTGDTHIATLNWGDGAGDTIDPAISPITANHLYADNGVYTLTVTVTDDDGAAGSDTLLVTVNNVAPVVDASLDAQIDEGSSFTSSGSFTDPGADSWATTVDYGDGTEVQTLTLNPDKTFSLNHVYSDNGVYTVTVTITDDDSGVGSDTATVTVKNVAPVVEAGDDAEIDEGSAFTSSGSFTDPGADSWTATVDYGDGTEIQELTLTGKTFNLSHVYADNGAYTVTVTVTDDDGGVGSDTATVTVKNVAPTVEVGSDQMVNEGDVVSLEPANFNDKGTLDTHTATINWGDSTLTESGAVTESPFGPPGSTTGADGTVSGSHVYADNGAYTVTVTVTDDDGASTSDTLIVTVNNMAPSTVAADDQITDEGTEVTLDVATYNDKGTADTHTATIDWGDGSQVDAGTVTESPFGPPGSAEGANGTVSGSHIYLDDGIYTVTVTVTDDDGGSDTVSFQFAVRNVPPSIVLKTPQGGEVLKGTFDITWTVTDVVPDPITVDVFFQLGDGPTFTIATGVENLTSLVFPDALSADGVFSWDTTAAAKDRGDYKIMVIAHDNVDASEPAISGAFTVDNEPLKITPVPPHPQIFNPVLGEKVHLCYYLSEPATVTQIEIFEVDVDDGIVEERELVKTLALNSEEQPGVNGHEWDGTDDTGKVLKDGKFLVRITATDFAGNVVTADGSLEHLISIEKHLPFIELLGATPNVFTPELGEATTISYRLFVNVKPKKDGKPDEKAQLQVDIRLFDASGNLVKHLFSGVEEGSSAGNDFSHNWDGKGADGVIVSPGVYTFGVTASKVKDNGPKDAQVANLQRGTIIVNTPNATLTQDSAGKLLLRSTPPLAPLTIQEKPVVDSTASQALLDIGSAVIRLDEITSDPMNPVDLPVSMEIVYETPLCGNFLNLFRYNPDKKLWGAVRKEALEEQANRFVAEIDNFGFYALLSHPDNTPPKVANLQVFAGMLSFTITDDLSGVDLDFLSVSFDDQVILDGRQITDASILTGADGDLQIAVNKPLTIDPTMEHLLKIECRDVAGNITERLATFRSGYVEVHVRVEPESLNENEGKMTVFAQFPEGIQVQQIFEATLNGVSAEKIQLKKSGTEATFKFPREAPSDTLFVLRGSFDDGTAPFDYPYTFEGADSIKKVVGDDEDDKGGDDDEAEAPGDDDEGEDNEEEEDARKGQ